MRVYATFTPSGLCGPYSAMIVRPATIVGSANGRSTSASTTPMPGKRSRTSTQAISVPMTAFTTVAIPAAASVSSSAETLAGLETTVQNPEKPPALTCTSSAASGSRTMMPR